MRKIKCTVSYPWAGIQDDVDFIEVNDNATEKDIDEIANEVFEDIIWGRISTMWEEV